VKARTLAAPSRIANLALIAGILPASAAHDDRDETTRFKSGGHQALALFAALDRLCDVVAGFVLTDRDLEVRAIPSASVWSADLAACTKRLEEVELTLCVYAAGDADRGLDCPLSPTSGPAHLDRPSWAERLEGGADALSACEDDGGSAILAREAKRWREYGLRPELAPIAQARWLLADFSAGSLRPGWLRAAQGTVARGREVFRRFDHQSVGSSWTVKSLATALRKNPQSLGRRLRDGGALVFKGAGGLNAVSPDQAIGCLRLTPAQVAHVERAALDECARAVRENTGRRLANAGFHREFNGD